MAAVPAVRSTGAGRGADAHGGDGRGRALVSDAAEDEGLSFAAETVPGMLEPFPIREDPATGCGTAEGGATIHL